MKPYGVTREVLYIKGHQSVSFRLNRCEFNHSFLVCSLPTDAAGLLGTDCLESTGAIMNFECGKLTFAGTGKVPRAYSVSPTGHVALSVLMW
jgi:hypothetical protein